MLGYDRLIPDDFENDFIINLMTFFLKLILGDFWQVKQHESSIYGKFLPVSFIGGPYPIAEYIITG